MIIFKHIQQLEAHLKGIRATGRQTGFVPTMGALHAGHISLIAQARLQTDVVVSSIFVNPTQFNDPKDYEKYPNTIEQDVYQLEKAGCDVLFLPAVTEIYPEGPAAPGKHFALGYLETVLDGSFRPGHFQGVCRVVERLLQIVQPDRLFLGQKDYQQCLVIGKLVDGMGIATRIEICATSREADGLAMSSRNLRLTEAERLAAPAIYQTLLSLQQQLQPGPLALMKAAAIEKLTLAGFRVDYVEIASAATLRLVDSWDGNTPLVALAAAFIGEVRLIDNLLLNQ